MILLLDLLSIAESTAALSASLAVVLVALVAGVTGVAMLHTDPKRRREARDVLRILLASRRDD